MKSRTDVPNFITSVMVVSAIDLLVVIAGFSIGLAGFAGIVAAVRGTQSAGNDAEKFFAGNPIIISFFSGLVALATLSIISVINEEWLWRVAVAIQAVAAMLLVADAAYRSKRTSKGNLQLQEKVLNVVIFIALSGNVLAQLVVAFGLWTSIAFTIFHAGLALHLPVGSINFYTLVFRPLKRE